MASLYDPITGLWTVVGSDYKPAAPKPTQIALDPFIYDADYCCALIRIGPAIFKCTDKARYKSNVCALHLHHDLIMAVPANAQ